VPYFFFFAAAFFLGAAFFAGFFLAAIMGHPLSVRSCGAKKSLGGFVGRVKHHSWAAK
jgi:hypothetical protein